MSHEGISLVKSLQTLAPDRGEWLASCPGQFIASKMPPVPICCEAVWPPEPVYQLVSLNHSNFQDRSGWRFLGVRRDSMIILVKFIVFLCLCNVLSPISIADPFLLPRPNLLFTGLKLNVIGYTWLHCQVPQVFDESEVGDLIKTLV